MTAGVIARLTQLAQAEARRRHKSEAISVEYGELINGHCEPFDRCEHPDCQVVRSALLDGSPAVEGDIVVGSRWKLKDRRLQREVVVVAVDSAKVHYRNVTTNRLAVSRRGQFKPRYSPLPASPVSPAINRKDGSPCED